MTGHEELIARRTYKYRIRNKSASAALRRHAIASNQIWNYCAAYQEFIRGKFLQGAKPRKWPSHFDLAKACIGTGQDFGIPQQTVQAVCRDFVKARNAARRAPRFRPSFGVRRSLGWVPFQPKCRYIKGDAVRYCRKTYKLFGTRHRPIPETAKGGCFSEDALGRWWLCIVVDVPERPRAVNGAVGIDLGLKAFATLSTGEKIVAPRIYRRYEAALGIAQRANNKQRVTRLHAKIKNCRTDFLHKLSTELAGRNALIAVGNVNASGLAKTRISKSVLDAGWSSFRNMLAYKAANYVEVDEKFTTQTCSCCGSVSSETRPRGIAGLGIRSWDCSDCGASHDRDVNAARNILRIGRGVTPLGEESRVAA